MAIIINSGKPTLKVNPRRVRTRRSSTRDERDQTTTATLASQPPSGLRTEMMIARVATTQTGGQDRLASGVAWGGHVDLHHDCFRSSFEAQRFQLRSNVVAQCAGLSPR